MEYITFVNKDNVMKAENALKADFDLASKQSIEIRDAKSLGIEKDGSFFIIDGSDEGVSKCKELIKEFEADASDEDASDEEKIKAKEVVKKEGDAAAAGMGGIFG